MYNISCEKTEGVTERRSEMTRVIDAKNRQKPILNMYELAVTHRNGSRGAYFVASRSEEIEGITALNHELKPAGVMLFGIHGNKLVLERRFRYPIDDYVYELPQGSSKRENH